MAISGWCMSASGAVPDQYHDACHGPCDCPNHTQTEGYNERSPEAPHPRAPNPQPETSRKG